MSWCAVCSAWSLVRSHHQFSPIMHFDSCRLCDFLLLGEDLQLDVPQFWANVSETVASVLVGTGAVLPITVLEQFIKLIEEQTSCVVSTFAVAVLMNMVRYSVRCRLLRSVFVYPDRLEFVCVYIRWTSTEITWPSALFGVSIFLCNCLDV